MAEMRRVLFVAEAVTLAHVGRLITLAECLDPEKFEICFACDPRGRRFLSSVKARYLPIKSIPSEVFLDRVDNGHPVYTERELEEYVEEELRLLSQVRPDFVVSDFRISLGVSARKLGIPLLSVVNAYWSSRVNGKFPLPETWYFRRMGWRVSSLLFKALRLTVLPMALRSQAAPMNRIRRRHGLPPLRELRDIYTDGDLKLYADTPELVPLKGQRPDERYLGPLLWSPEGSLPDWWDQLDPDLPCVYVTLGSSGNTQVISRIVDALSALPLQVLLATAGRWRQKLPPRFFSAEYLPGMETARRSSLVICNGGSGTVYQALSVGTPVLGIISNVDQAWTMSFVEGASAGKAIRHWQVHPEKIRKMALSLLGNPEFRRGAEKVREGFSRYDVKRGFLESVEFVLKNAASVNSGQNG